MRRTSALIPAFCCLAFTDCNDGQKDRDDAAYFCADFSEGVCEMIGGACSGEQDEAFCQKVYDDECYDALNEWHDYCALEAQQDCIDMFLTSNDQEAFQFVIERVCPQGFSEDRRTAVTTSVCEDVADEDNYFDPAPPYLDWCPCLESLTYYEDENGYLYCGERG